MTVFFRPCGDITMAPAARCQRDLDLFECIATATGLHIQNDPDVDYEDWMEPACLLEQAIHAGLKISILPALSLREAIANPLVTIEGISCRDMLIGRQLRSDPREMGFFNLGWPAPCDQTANHYAELATFHRHAGRRLALADMPGDPEGRGDRTALFGEGFTSSTLGNAMASLSPGEIIVKQVYPGKSLPLCTYTLDADFTPEQGQSLFLNDVGFHFARFEGDPAALLVQEKITMTHETRFFLLLADGLFLAPLASSTIPPSKHLMMTMSCRRSGRSDATQVKWMSAT